MPSRSRSRGPAAASSNEVAGIRSKSRSSLASASPTRARSISKKIESADSMRKKQNDRSRSRNGAKVGGQEHVLSVEPALPVRRRTTMNSTSAELFAAEIKTVAPTDKDTGRAGHSSMSGCPVPAVFNCVLSTFSYLEALAKRSNNFRVAAVVGFYFVTSIVMVFCNKALLKIMPYPMSMTLMQMIATIVIGTTFGIANNLFSKSYSVNSATSTLALIFPPFEYRPVFALQTIPISIVFVLTVIFNNSCLSYVPISFHNVARAWTILCNVALARVVYGALPSRKELFFCAVVVGGYLLACAGKDGLTPDVIYGELAGYVRQCVFPMFSGSSAFQAVKVCADLSAGMKGLVFGFLGSLSLATYSLFVRRDTTRMPLSNMQLVSYVNVNGAIFLGALVLLTGEHKAALADADLGSREFFVTLLVVSVAGYLINFSTYLQITQTSPLTHHVSGTAKAAVQSLLGWLTETAPISSKTIVGNAVTILGCFGYTWVRHQRSIAEEHGQSASTKSALTAPKATEIGYPDWFLQLKLVLYRCTHAPPRQ